MSKKTLTFTIEGEFTAFELASITSFVRSLDGDDRHWKIFIEDKEGTTLKEAMKMLQDAMPPMPGRKTTPFEVHRKQ